SESVMELRMQPLERDSQRCLSFNVTTSQRAKIFAYRDHYDNVVHYFDAPAHHSRLEISAESVVSVEQGHALPKRLTPEHWAEIDALAGSGAFIDWLLP